MRFRMPAVFVLAVAALLAAKKTPPAAATRGENQDIIVYVTLYYTPEQVKEHLGSDLQGHYIVADVKVEPKYGKEIAIDRDDFMLRTDKDGERTKPFAPTQIAGRGALVIRQTSDGGGGAMAQENDPVYGGIPGTVGGPLGYPGGGVIGSGGGGGVAGADAKAETGAHEKENPILKVLRERALPEKKTEQPVSGLLYFPMEKQKLKDLEMYYGSKENLIRMRFRQQQ
jgi:hypothetical protein